MLVLTVKKNQDIIEITSETGKKLFILVADDPKKSKNHVRVRFEGSKEGFKIQRTDKPENRND